MIENGKFFEISEIGRYETKDVRQTVRFEMRRKSKAIKSRCVNVIFVNVWLESYQIRVHMYIFD